MGYIFFQLVQDNLFDLKSKFNIKHIKKVLEIKFIKNYKHLRLEPTNN